MVYDKGITIEKKDKSSGKWGNFATLHARVNKTGGNEYLNAGAVRSQSTLTFEVRYSPKVEEIRSNTQLFRVFYRNNYYNVVDYDDYMEKHQSIKLLGVSY